MQQARRRGSGWILQISKIRKGGGRKEQLISSHLISSHLTSLRLENKGGGRKEQLISSHLTSLHLENFARDDWDFHFKPPKKSKFKT